MLAPKKIDGRELTDAQREAFSSILGKLVGDAGHDVETAVDLATVAFRRLHEEVPGDENGWRARRVVQLSSAGCTLRNTRFWRREAKEQCA